MSWAYIGASLFWGAAAVSVVAWLFGERLRSPRIAEERRSFPRPPLNYRATLIVQKLDKTSALIRVRGRDLTRLGAKVMSSYPVPKGSVVVIEIPSVKLMGVCNVVRCVSQNLKYCIGLRFCSPLMRSYDGAWTISVVNESSQKALASR